MSRLIVTGYTGLFIIVWASSLMPVAFEIIIPSYNNERWCFDNLQSAAMQKYDDFHITYIDDCSSDATGKRVDKMIAQNKAQDRVTVIHNKERRGTPLENIYNAIHALPDMTVAVILDGDDRLAGSSVLEKLNKVYTEFEVWLTYGQFAYWPKFARNNFCLPFPKSVVEQNKFRKIRTIGASHLRTCYAWLFKKIAKEDLMHEGTFFKMSTDLAMMLPMLEMAGDRHAFIPDILYLYNTENNLSCQRVDGDLQTNCEKIIRSKERYSRLEGIVINPGKPKYLLKAVKESKK